MVPVERIPSSPPHVTIKIISPDDSFRGVREKSEECRAWGVQHIWLIDPACRTLTICANGIRDVASVQLPELGLELTPEQVFG